MPLFEYTARNAANGQIQKGQVEVKSQGTFDRLDADFAIAEGREMASPVGKFTRVDPRTRLSVKATLAIDIRDCIGCDVCVAHCDKGVLRMVDGKALVDLRHLNKCDMDGECVEVCPTDVVSLVVQPADGEVAPDVAAALPTRKAS